MAEIVESGVLIRDVETKNIMTKSTLPVGGYSVNPYVGCTHGCKYCYASFMKRFTGHTEPWGTFLDVKHWPAIKNPRKYAGQRVVIGSVTDGYLPQEEQFGNTRKLLEQLKGSGAEILICTKSDLVVRDIDLLKEMGKVTVSWSINTLDEDFKNDMDSAVSIERRLDAMKQVYDAGIRTVCFIAPVFPGITDFERNTLTSCRCTTPSIPEETGAISGSWRSGQSALRENMIVPLWTTNSPTAGQSRGIRSSWITFITRKCAARKTPASESDEPPNAKCGLIASQLGLFSKRACCKIVVLQQALFTYSLFTHFCYLSEIFGPSVISSCPASHSHPVGWFRQFLHAPVQRL